MSGRTVDRERPSLLFAPALPGRRSLRSRRLRWRPSRPSKPRGPSPFPPCAGGEASGARRAVVSPRLPRPLGARHLRRDRPSGQGRRFSNPAMPRLRHSWLLGRDLLQNRDPEAELARRPPRSPAPRDSSALRIRAGRRNDSVLGLQAPPIGRSGRFAGGRGHRAADARWGSDDPARREARRGRRGAPPCVVPARSRPEASRAEGERWPRRADGQGRAVAGTA